LYCCSDGVRGRGAPVTNLSHTASFHSNERIAPSNHGIKHLDSHGLRTPLTAYSRAKTKKPPEGGSHFSLYFRKKMVAGAGSDLHLLREQVKMVAGTGIDHNLQSAPVKMVAGGRNHLYRRSGSRRHLSVCAASDVAEKGSFFSVLFRTAA
ncbi:MAG: hypothetical protein WCY11_14145, partial [Novosphingobium sp.]